MMEILLLVLSSSAFSADDFLGMPPGDRDAKLVAAAPDDAALYLEWASRSSGESGAPGIDGFVADPEVIEFRDRLISSIKASIEFETKNGPPEAQITGRVVPELILNLITKPGCLYVRLDPNLISDDAGAEVPIPMMVAGALEGALIINAEDDADAVAKNILDLMDLLPPDLRKTGLERRQLPIPIPGQVVMLHRHDSYFILGFGEQAIDKAIAGLDGDGPGLGGNERFQTAYGNVSMDRTGSVLWLDTKQIMNKATVMLGVQGAMVQGILSLTGLSAIDSVVASAGVIEGQITGQTFVTTGGSLEGILALAAGRGITVDDFELIPSDSDMVLAISFNPVKVFKEARRIVGQADPGSQQQMDAIVQQIETELGFSLTEDLPEAFGEVWTVHDSKSAGGVLVTSAVVALEVKDAEKAYTIFSQLMKVLKATMDSPPEDTPENRRRRGVYLQSVKFMDRSIYYINTVGDDIPFAPSFCCTNKQMLVALHPQALKAHLRWADEGGESYKAELPESGEAICVCEYEAKAMLRYAYAIAPYVGQIAFSEMQQEGFKGIDIFYLPSARAILPYCNDSHSYIKRTEDGIHSYSGHAIPIPGASSMLMQLPLAGGFMMFSFMRALEQIGGAPVPGRAIEVQAAPRAVLRAAPALAPKIQVKKPAIQLRQVPRKNAP